MAQVRTEKISPATGTAVTVVDSGDTFTVPTGVTLTNSGAMTLPASITATTEVKTNKISPGSGTAMTWGDSGDTFTIPSGATMTNNGTATGFGDIVLLGTQTASSSASLSFTSVSASYKVLRFSWAYMNPATDATNLEFQASTDNGSTYALTINSGAMRGYMPTPSGSGTMSYQSGSAQWGGTSYQHAGINVGNASGRGAYGEMLIYNNGSSTVKKDFAITGAGIYSDAAPFLILVTGLIDTTSPLDAFSFKYSSGNIAVGRIKLWGYT